VSFFWLFFDVSTDAVLVNSLVQTHRPLAYIASVSLLFSIGSVVTMTFLDVMSFAANPEDKALRRVLKMRWGLLVFVPLEDIVMISIACFVFYKDSSSFAAFLSILVSILSIVFFHCLKVILEKKGVNDIMTNPRLKFSIRSKRVIEQEALSDLFSLETISTPEDKREPETATVELINREGTLHEGQTGEADGYELEWDADKNVSILESDGTKSDLEVFE